jgi:hypothetical protein
MNTAEQRLSAHALYTQVLAATKNNKVKWNQIEAGQFKAGFFSASFSAGSVTISKPVNDQRDGDYCTFTVYDPENKKVSETTVGIELWRVITYQPANNVIANLLAELGSL